jgi:DNA polymerase-1
VEISGVQFDTMVAAYLLESTQRTFALRDLAWRKLQVELPSVASMLGTGRKAITMAQIGPDVCGEFACKEADLVRQLVPILERDLAENEQVSLYN